MVVFNPNNLIGDFLGTIPAMIEFNKQTPCEFIIADSVASLFDMIPAAYKMKRVPFQLPYDKAIDLHGSFAYADKHQLHMIQAFFNDLGLPVPADIPRPQLFVPSMPVPEYDYILAPFSRSLPPEQKWPRERWQNLVDRMPNKTFCLFGASKFDDAEFVTGTNVNFCFDKPFEEVANVMKACRHGVISVVTGISHLCYALNVKNYLFFNQGMWGKNPEAVCMTKNIHDIGVDEVLNVLNA